MEDDYLWQDEEEAEAETTPSDTEFDPYDDCLTNVSQDVIDVFMISDDEQEDFEGFYEGLQSPMYYFLSHLSCIDICISSVTVPKILVNFLRQRQTITYNQCLAQMFFLMSFTVTEAAMLAIMAYDRYAAICKPLHYSHLMNTQVCAILAFATWIWGFLDAVLHTALSSRLHFCGVNKIHHIFCDIPPLMKISCNDVHINQLATHIASFFVGVAPFLFTILSYFFILSSILKVRSTAGKHKAFSTCASHLTVVIVYFGNALLNYNRPSAGYSLETDTLVSTMYCIIPPMLNPLSYSLRNKEVKGALKKVLESQRKVYMGSRKQ